METLLDTDLLEPIEILGTCGPCHRRGLMCCLTDLSLWVHKKGVFALKVWYFHMGDKEGITSGGITNLYGLQNYWVCTLLGTATKERKGQNSNFELKLLFWCYLNLSRLKWETDPSWIQWKHTQSLRSKTICYSRGGSDGECKFSWKGKAVIGLGK